MFLKSIVKALIVLSLSGAAHARVILELADLLELAEQLDMSEQLAKIGQTVIAKQTTMVDENEEGGLAEQDDLDTSDPSKSLSIIYGKCYHIATKKRDYLGHNNVNKLVFGDRKNSGLFQVCKHKDSCTPNHPNKVVQEDEEFVLYDVRGYSKNYVMNLAGLFFPRYNVYDNIVRFWGRKECFDEDDCPSVYEPGTRSTITMK